MKHLAAISIILLSILFLSCSNEYTAKNTSKKFVKEEILKGRKSLKYKSISTKMMAYDESLDGEGKNQMYIIHKFSHLDMLSGNRKQRTIQLFLSNNGKHVLSFYGDFEMDKENKKKYWENAYGEGTYKE